MISFSAQRCTQIFRPIAALFCALIISGLFSHSAHAQSSDDLFRGTWQIDTPTQGALVMLLKNQGRASYFWGDNSDRSVYQGTWTSNGETATLTWTDGSQHRIERDNLGFTITKITSSGNESYQAKAQQVPAEVLGQWAKAPTKENDMISDRDQAKGYFGIWKVGKDDVSADYVFIESDRSAATTAGGPSGLRGSWAKQGSELHIAWDNGQYSILRPNKREFAYKIIEAGQIIEDDETKMRPIARTIKDKVPSTWMTAYQAEREIHTGGIAFSSRKIARAFYRGNWIIKHSNGKFERVEITRFGNLNTSIDRSLEGDWKLQGQDIFMRWDNGMRKILSPIGRGFVIYEYKPGRPLDGVPTRTRAAAPTEASKLAEHLKGREDVAQQMISLAEAAGFDPSQQQNAGWGRTFARWAWPFGADESVGSPDAILAEEFEEANETDPWWWPFWSENATAELDSTSAEIEDTTPEAEEQPSELSADGAVEKTTRTAATVAAQNSTATTETATETATEAPAPENKSRSAREWIWPF